MGGGVIEKERERDEQSDKTFSGRIQDYAAVRIRYAGRNGPGMQKA